MCTIGMIIILVFITSRTHLACIQRQRFDWIVECSDSERSITSESFFGCTLHGFPVFDARFEKIINKSVTNDMQ